MTETLWYIQLYEADQAQPKTKTEFPDFASVRSYITQHAKSGRGETVVVVVPPHASKDERAQLRALGVKLM